MSQLAPTAPGLTPTPGSTPATLSDAAPLVSLRSVSKRFGQGDRAVLALDSISLDVQPGEFLCLVGASGCGKSTLLNLVAGLEQPSAGALELRGGRAALMFQEAALFPWLTVAQNVDFPLHMQGMRRSERRQRVAEMLALVHLTSFANRRPHELSGGMRQRVALARALVQGAGVLLMDEPFGALDAMMRDRLHDELERLWQEAGVTVIFVTHNVREAVRLGDRVILLSSRPGRVAAEFPVAFDRPRRIDSADVAALAATITDCLREEAHRAAPA